MPIFKYINAIRRAVVCVLSSLMLAGIMLPVEARAQEVDDYLRQFHSFVPPQKPRFILPRIDNVLVWRSDMKKAKKAWRKGNYKKTRKYLKRALKKGNLNAAWYLGHMYQQGRGVDRDDARAFKYYREVAISYEPGMPMNRRLRIVLDSLVRVADAYREGSKSAGVKRDSARAFRHYTTAASYKHPGAYFGLGVIYLKGLGRGKNPRWALDWLSVAARKRYAPAEALLGDLYWDGTLVRQSRARAIMWYILARQTANPAVHSQIFDRLEVMLTDVGEDQRAAAQNLALRWSEQNPVRATIVPTAE